MVAPSFKKVTGGDAGTTAKYGAPDIRYIQEILDATHATDRLQASVIEGLHKPLNAFVGIEGSNFVARDRDGVILHSSSTNATTALQTAFNQGGRIHIDPGTYNITSTLLVPSNTYIQAHVNAYIKGPALVAGVSTPIPIIKNKDIATTGNTNIILQGGTWDGNSADDWVSTFGPTAGIHFENCDYVWVDHVRSLYMLGEGIKVKTVGRAIITNNYVYWSKLESDGTGKAGIMASLTAHECVIANNIVEEAGGEALGTNRNDDRVVIMGNICRRLTRGRGYILMEGDSTNNEHIRSSIIAYNIVVSKYQCIHIQSPNGIIIANNNLTNVGTGDVIGLGGGFGDGIRIAGTGENVFIYNNMIRDVEHHGIIIRNTISKVVIENNSIMNVSREGDGLFHGIFFDPSGPLSQIKIADNMIGDTRSPTLNGDMVVFKLNNETCTNCWVHDNQGFSNSGGISFDWSGGTGGRFSGDCRFFHNPGIPGTSKITNPFNNTHNEVGEHLSASATYAAAPSASTLYTVRPSDISMTITGSGTVTVEDSGGELLLDSVSIPRHGLFLARGWRISFTGSPSVVVFPHG